MANLFLMQKQLVVEHRICGAEFLQKISHLNGIGHCAHAGVEAVVLVLGDLLEVGEDRLLEQIETVRCSNDLMFICMFKC